MISSTTAQSIVRHVLSILVVLGAVHLNDNQIEGIVPSLAVLLVLLIAPLWSWLNQRALYWAQPPEGAANNRRKLWRKRP